MQPSPLLAAAAIVVTFFTDVAFDVVFGVGVAIVGVAATLLMDC